MDPGQLARIRNYLDLRLEAFRRHDPPARRARAGAPRVPGRRSGSRGRSWPTSRSSRCRPTRSPRCRRSSPGSRARSRTRSRCGSGRSRRAGSTRGARIRAEPAVRRRADGDPLAPAAPSREAQAGHALRRVRLRAQRLALHAPARVEPAGVLLPVRSYVFVSEIAEVTQAFRTLPGGAGHRVGAQGARRSTTTAARTSATRSTASPRRASRSTAPEDDVLILGDARNNYNDPQAWALRQIRERVKGIIWLNPEGQWGWGDRRQRDAALRAGLRHRPRVPDARPAGGGRRQPRPGLVAPPRRRAVAGQLDVVRGG